MTTIYEQMSGATERIIFTPAFVGNNIYDRLSRKWACWGETEDGWLYENVG